MNERAVDSDSVNIVAHLKYFLDNTLSNKECFSRVISEVLAWLNVLKLHGMSKVLTRVDISTPWGINILVTQNTKFAITPQEKNVFK